MTATTIEFIKQRLGPAGWVDGEGMQAFATGLMGYAGEALLVARPQSTTEVAEVVRACAEANIAIVPQGGNTCVTGGSVPRAERPALILSLARMNRILSVDPDNGSIAAEAGCILETVQQAAVAVDRVFAPDWGARGTATVGGAVASNGGGMNVLRYGNTREQVLGLEVVLADGRVWDGMRTLRKDNSGYDMKHLFIGSEGTLGIITRAVFRLHPRQPVSQTMMAVISDMSRLMTLFAETQALAGDRLASFEIINDIGLEKALARYPALKRPLDTRADFYLLIRLAGRDSVEALSTRLFESGFESGILDDAVLTQSQAQEDNIWQIRDQMIPKQYFPDHKMLKWDASLPLSRIVDFLEQASAIASNTDPEAICYAIGHIGDGNIHYSVFLRHDQVPGLDARVQEIYTRVDRLLWDMGGSVTAEHGVGVEMYQRLKRQKSPIEYEMMTRLRGLFDPRGIMNPGALCDYPDP